MFHSKKGYDADKVRNFALARLTEEARGRKLREKADFKLLVVASRAQPKLLSSYWTWSGGSYSSRQSVTGQWAVSWSSGIYSNVSIRPNCPADSCGMH